MSALLVQAGRGETITGRPARFVEIRAARDELAVTDSRYAPGESGPGAHVHREHADCFWVLEGELAFDLGGGGERVRAPAGSFVLVPPGVVHTFRNEGPGNARFLNLHAPSMGFDRHLRAMRDGDDPATEDFDTFDPPADGGLPASAALVRRPDEGERLALGPSSAVVKAGSEHGGGSLALTETTIAPGFPGPVPHFHEAMVDSFYVLDGTLTVRLGEEAVEAAAGTYVLVPPGVVHTFANPGGEPVRFLNAMAPGGLERYLREVVAATPPGAGPPDPALMARIASRYDFHAAG